MNSILYLDDEVSNLNVFKASFRHDYNILVANTSQEAMQILFKESVQVVISDQCMADTTGIDFLSEVKAKFPDTIRLILTAYTDIDVVINAFTECGIYRFISKPWDTLDVKRTLDNALEAYSLKKQNKALIEHLENTNLKLEGKIQQRTLELIVANNTKSKIFSCMAKELEKPVKQFSEFSDLMMSFDNETLFDKAKKHAPEMRDSLLVTNMLLEKLYRWASLELKTSAFEPTKCILNNFINSNVEAHQINAMRHRIVLKNETGTDKVTIKADASMLNFMINNVILSAIKVGEKNSDVIVGAHRQNGHGVISLSGKSQELCEFMTHMANESHILDETLELSEHQDAKLSFTLFSEYLKMMDGKMLVSPSGNLNQYSICFSYPSMN